VLSGAPTLDPNVARRYERPLRHGSGFPDLSILQPNSSTSFSLQPSW
jgi:hypothetical protein